MNFEGTKIQDRPISGSACPSRIWARLHMTRVGRWSSTRSPASRRLERQHYRSINQYLISNHSSITSLIHSNNHSFTIHSITINDQKINHNHKSTYPVSWTPCRWPHLLTCVRGRWQLRKHSDSPRVTPRSPEDPTPTDSARHNARPEHYQLLYNFIINIFYQLQLLIGYQTHIELENYSTSTQLNYQKFKSTLLDVPKKQENEKQSFTPSHRI